MLTICLFPLSFISASQVIKKHLNVIQNLYSKTKLQLRFYHAKVFILPNFLIYSWQKFWTNDKWASAYAYRMLKFLPILSLDMLIGVML